MHRLTRRSFLAGGVAALTGLGAWRWLTTATPEDGLPWPLRRVLRFNQGLAEAGYSPGRLAPTFPDGAAEEPARTNGLIGLSGKVNAAAWQLRVQHEGRAAEQTISLRDLQGLPRTDLVTELKCVEGWSQVMHFGGVCLIDLVTRLVLQRRFGL
jgi:DMSO/TMAO reductase YedYZ molybdopterin-dependent catalytic subunit